LSYWAAHIPGIPAEAALEGGSPNHPLLVVNPGIPRNLDFPLPEKGPLAPNPWRIATVLWLSRPDYDGPALIRGRQLDGSHKLGFGSAATPQWELRLPAGSWEEQATPLKVWPWGQTAHPRPGWRLAIAQTRIRATGCYAYQVDGHSFSYRIVFSAIMQPGG
jgi:hypothetical protein